MKRIATVHCVLFSWLVIGVATLCHAQFKGISSGNAGEPDADDVPPVVKLNLHPAAEQRPALKYRLMPRYIEQQHGNAASYYYRALLIQASLPEQLSITHTENYEKWNETPLDELPLDEMRQWVDQHQGVLAELNKAYLRDDCDWDIGIRELKGTEVFALLIPEAQEMRQLARFLLVKIRVELAEKRFDDAFHSLQLGYKMAHDSAKHPTLIGGLVGIAIVAIMNGEVEEFINAGASPNLYWAIASLPNPVADVGPSLRQEMEYPLQIFPFLKDAETAERTPDEWRRLVFDSLRQLGELNGDDLARTDSWKYELAATALLMRAYPQAKRELVGHGFDAERVEAMPVAQVVAIHEARIYEHAYHELFKWTLLPYTQAYAEIEATEKRLQQEGFLGPYGRSKEIIPIVSVLMPALGAASLAPVRVERQLEALRTIEAIRMHAAVNEGALPKSLTELKIVPPGLDPLSGQPFPYRLEGDTAVLDIPPPPGKQWAYYGRRYEITISK